MRATGVLAASLCLFVGSLAGQKAAQPVTVMVKNEEAVNSQGLDFSPTFFQDGIVFISTNTAGLKKMKDERLKLSTMSILRSRRGTEGALAAPEPFSKEITSKYHEGPVCFDRTTEHIYFSSNVHKKGQAKKAKDGTQKMKLYVSAKTGEAWGEPAPLPFNTDEYDDCHPALSIDGDKLFFASNRPGGFGGMDLYVAFKLGDTWSEPVNLGPKVNTNGNEAFPFLHADNTLYFASDGRPGQGKLDLFYTFPDGSDWMAPVNLGAPFNTKNDDLGLIVDLDKINGYYSSDGNGGKGGDDVFSFHVENGTLDDYLLQNRRVPEQELEVLTTVLSAEDNSPMSGATVRILNIEQSNVVGRDSFGNLISLQNIGGQDVMKVVPSEIGPVGTTDDEGHFSAKLKPAKYTILVGKPGFQTQQVIKTIAQAGTEVVVNLEKAQDKVRWNATLFNDLTNAPLAGATLVLKNEATGKEETVTTDADGNVDYYLEKNAAYSVGIQQNGRSLGSTKVNTADWKDENAGKMTLNIASAPIAAGTVIELPNIYYNYNDGSLRPDARKDLDLVAAILQQYPSMVVELASHTDSRGTSEYNLELSQRRADNVAEYLVNRKHVDKSRLKPVGYGENAIRNQCKEGVQCSEKDHSRNRRTEIRVLTGADGAEVISSDDATAKSEKPAKVNQSPERVQVTNSASIRYFIIAGSFLMENRAHNQAARLRAAGYGETEVMQFDGSPFFSVVVKKADSLDEAYALRQQLDEQEKFESFVKPVRR